MKFPRAVYGISCLSDRKRPTNGRTTRKHNASTMYGRRRYKIFKSSYEVSRSHRVVTMYVGHCWEFSVKLFSKPTSSRWHTMSRCVIASPFVSSQCGMIFGDVLIKRVVMYLQLRIVEQRIRVFNIAHAWTAEAASFTLGKKHCSPSPK